MTSLALQSREGAKLSQSVYETILEAIIAGRFSPGDVISEVELSRQLDVSRTPVHEAIGALCKDGLVNQEANRRPTIATFTREDAHDVFEMRKLLEGEGAFRSATRIDRPSLDLLRATGIELAETRDDLDWLDRWVDFDEEFHAVIAQACGSRRLREDIGQYRLLHRVFNKLHTSVDVLSQAIEEHQRIVDALARRDAEGAKQAMIDHIGEWQTFFVQGIPE
jgi:DNA-binding GntR family transcriptional regulator